jgi:hypothetical protein
MGVEDNEFQIANLNANTSFFDWFTKTNDEIFAKLNKLEIYNIDIQGSGVQGISAALGNSAASNATAGFLRLGLADTVPHGITLQGDLVVSGSTDFVYTTPAGATTPNIGTGGFVCISSAGGVTHTNVSNAGVTTMPFHKNETIGIVQSISGNTVRVANRGIYDEFVGLTTGQLYYLDPTVKGGYTFNRPSVSGETVKPVFLSLTETSGILQIGASDVIGSTFA